jgi:hypothetical protein
MSERRDLIRVMHHTLVVQPDGYGYSRCQQPGRRLNVTTDRAGVTCKRCLKIPGPARLRAVSGGAAGE